MRPSLVNWNAVSYIEPPEGVVVMTKIDDEYGTRNKSMLKRVGNLWFIPGGDMYVYYTPTHWKFVQF